MWLLSVLLAVEPMLDQAGVEAEIEKIVRGQALAGSKTGISVHALEADKPLYDKGGDQLLSPASNIKLVTTAAALTLLKPDYRFKTTVLADAPIGPDGTLSGNLYIKGGGDPSLVSERMWFIVNELWHSGLRRITGNVVGDDSFFDAERTQVGWDEDASDRAYQAMTSGLSVNFNTITLRLTPAPQAGRMGKVAFDPPTEFAKLDASVMTQGKRTRVQIDVTPVENISADKVKVKGSVASGDNGRAFWRKVDYPTEFAAHMFAAFIKSSGVQIEGKVATGVTPASAVTLLLAESPRLTEIVSDLNKTSNNFVAEQIVKTLGAELMQAPGTWPKGLAVIKQFMTSLGIEEGKYTMQNGSGLGDVNRISPKHFVTVLKAVWKNPLIAPEYVSSLGVAASSGTLRNRMMGGPAAYRVRAKTGSLSNACSLSGYVSTLSGQTLAFSILVNGFKRMSAVHDAQDKIAEALVRWNGR
jgi:serine-type D-Ala-D-Ala carboxypeptidase/endopeptidase (penicillin-binding protein 4)